MLTLTRRRFTGGNCRLRDEKEVVGCCIGREAWAWPLYDQLHEEKFDEWLLHIKDEKELGVAVARSVDEEKFGSGRCTFSCKKGGG